MKTPSKSKRKQGARPRRRRTIPAGATSAGTASQGVGTSTGAFGAGPFGAGAFAGDAFSNDAFATPEAGLPAHLRSTEVAAVQAPVGAVAGKAATFAANAALSERPAEIRDAARALSQEFTAQVEELKRSRPNDPDRLAKHDDLVAFLDKMAAGLSTLADALDRAVKEASEGKPEPVFLGKAAEVARQLQLGAIEWLEQNRTTLIEVPIRMGLFGLGLAFVHALGVDGNLVTTLIAGLALKQAPKSRKR